MIKFTVSNLTFPNLLSNLTCPNLMRTYLAASYSRYLKFIGSNFIKFTVSLLGLG
ncbi:hypothetical protein [Campylobacter rectus]|uniref:hypothetical protein n=1 Tax=Campylobacter rectus TaxID=203 RepID=UPI00163B14BE|nr:hypothetical protein [Campylobacter rectus]